MCCLPQQPGPVVNSVKRSWPQRPSREEPSSIRNMDRWDCRHPEPVQRLAGWRSVQPSARSGFGREQWSERHVSVTWDMSCPAPGYSISFLREKWRRSGKIQRYLVPLEQTRSLGHGQTEGKSQVDPWWKHGPTAAAYPFQISTLSSHVSKSSSHGAHQPFHTPQEIEITIHPLFLSRPG